MPVISQFEGDDTFMHSCNFVTIKDESGNKPSDSVLHTVEPHM